MMQVLVAMALLLVGAAHGLDLPLPQLQEVRPAEALELPGLRAHRGDRCWSSYYHPAGLLPRSSPALHPLGAASLAGWSRACGRRAAARPGGRRPRRRRRSRRERHRDPPPASLLGKELRETLESRATRVAGGPPAEHPRGRDRHPDRGRRRRRPGAALRAGEPAGRLDASTSAARSRTTGRSSTTCRPARPGWCSPPTPRRRTACRSWPGSTPRRGAAGRALLSPHPAVVLLAHLLHPLRALAARGGGGDPDPAGLDARRRRRSRSSSSRRGRSWP